MAYATQVELEIHTNVLRLKKQMDKQNRTMRNSFARMERTSKKSLNKMSAHALRTTKLFAGLAVVAALTATTRAITSSLVQWGNLERVLADVKIKTGATTKEMESFREVLKSTNLSSVFNLQELAAGAAFMAQAGLSIDQINNSLKSVADTAAASGESFTLIADIVTNVGTAMGLTGDEVNRVGDILFTVAKGANTTIQQMGEAMKMFSPIAKEAGLSIEQMAAWAGVLGNVGIQGTLAGTQVKRALTAILAPTSRQAAAFRRLGVSALDVKGKMRDLNDIVDDFIQSEATYKDLLDAFGERGAPGFNALIKQRERYNELVAEGLSSEDASRIAAEERVDNLAGDLTKLDNAWETLKNTFAGDTPIGDFARSIVQDVTDFVNSEGLKKFILTLGETIPAAATAAGDAMKTLWKTVSTIYNWIKVPVDAIFNLFLGRDFSFLKDGALLAFFYLAQKVVRSIFGWVRALPKKLKAVKTALKGVLAVARGVFVAFGALLLANPWVWLVAGIAGLVVVIAGFSNEIMALGKTIWDWVTWVAGAVANIFKNVFGKLWQWVKEVGLFMRKAAIKLVGMVNIILPKSMEFDTSAALANLEEVEESAWKTNEAFDLSATWDKNLAKMRETPSVLDQVMAKFGEVKARLTNSLMPGGSGAEGDAGGGEGEVSAEGEQGETKTEAAAVDSNPIGDAWQKVFDGIQVGGHAAAAGLTTAFADSVQSIVNNVQRGKASVGAMWTETALYLMQGAGKLGKFFKKIAIIDALINTYTGITAALKLGWPMGIAAAALIAAKGFAQVSAIRGKNYPTAQLHGGIDDVPDTGSYFLEGGERVLSASLNADLKGFMQKKATETKQKIVNVYLESKDKYTGEDIEAAFSGSMGTVVLQSAVR